MRVLLMLLAAVPAFSQFLDLATDRTGSILLLRTMFRQQAEADVSTEQKIYQYRDRAWTRLTVFEPGGGIIPESDREKLNGLGVGKLFAPGATTHEIADYIRAWVEKNRNF